MAAADLIVGRKGDSLLGTVLDANFQIKTAFGNLTIASKRVAWIHFTNPPQFVVDEIWLHSGDHLLGKVSGASIRFRPAGGKEIRVPYSTINTLMLNGGVNPKARGLTGA